MTGTSTAAGSATGDGASPGESAAAGPFAGDCNEAPVAIEILSAALQGRV